MHIPTGIQSVPAFLCTCAFRIPDPYFVETPLLLLANIPDRWAQNQVYLYTYIGCLHEVNAVWRRIDRWESRERIIRRRALSPLFFLRRAVAVECAVSLASWSFLDARGSVRRINSGKSAGNANARACAPVPLKERSTLPHTRRERG